MGKGYLIDIVGEIVEKNDIHDFFINAGGDIVVKSSGETNKRIGLENPENAKQAVGLVEINNMSICGSAGNRRVWDKYHHIINPNNCIVVNIIIYLII